MVCQWFDLKTTGTVSPSLASKPVVRVFWLSLKIKVDGFTRFGLKIGGDGFSWFGLKSVVLVSWFDLKNNVDVFS
jgi:hypothetical protein